MAVIDATSPLETFNDAGGGVRQAQINNPGNWTTPFVPVDIDLPGFNTEFSPTPLQIGYPWTPGSPIQYQEILVAKIPNHFAPPYRAALPVDATVCPFPDYSTIFWFDRLHILPGTAQATSLGNLVSDVDTQFEVFNADRITDVNISALNEVGTDGFTIVSGPAAPFLIPAYRSAFYTIRAESEFGPPTIDATYTWVPSTAGFSSVFVTFTGNRITLFGFVPQQNPVRAMNFQTAIVESYNGTEQRMAVRQNPEMELTYEFVFGGTDDPYYDRPMLFEHQMFDSLGRAWAVPDWPDRTVLTSAVSPSDTTIFCDTVDRNFEVGELVVLWRDYDDLEALEITSITATSITVGTAFAGSWAVADTVVLPSWIGFLRDNVKQLIYKTAEAARWTTTFRRKNNITWDQDGSPLPNTEFHQSIPFWPRKWLLDRNSLDRTWRRNIEFVPGLGTVEQDYRYTTPKRANSIVVEMVDRQDYIEMRGWMMYLRGRQRSFWLPSYTENFKLTQTAAGGGSVMRVVYTGYERFVFQREQFNNIRVTLTDGTVVNHEIIDSADAGSGAMDLTVTPAIGSALSPAVDYTIATVVRIEYITKHRLNTDQIVFRGLPITDQWRLSLPIVEVLGEV